MPKEIKEKIIDILEDFSTDTESKTPIEDYISEFLELFSQEKQKWVEEIKKKNKKHIHNWTKWEKWDDEPGMAGGKLYLKRECKICGIIETNTQYY